MNPNEFISSIYKQIEEDDIRSAINDLKILLKNSPKLHELLLQSSRYHDVLKQIRAGIIDFKNATITKNQVKLALLELVGEIERQETSNHEIKDELTNAISIVNSKNVVWGNITAGGDINIGDKTFNTESKASKWLRWFLFLFVPVLAIGGSYFWYKSEELKKPLRLKVRIKNQTPNAQLPEMSGTLVLAYGGSPITQNDISSEALFDEIPANYRGESVDLTFNAQGFIPVDTTFILASEVIELSVYRNDDLAVIKGTITDENTNPLEQVKVSTDCCETQTQQSGDFLIRIPFEHQRLQQRITVFKEGFKRKDFTTPVIPGESVRLILHKQ